MLEGASHRGTILLAEDGSKPRISMSETLRSSGYHVLEAADGASALEINRRYPGIIDLLITPIVMRGINGPELRVQWRQRHPELRVLFVWEGGRDLLREADAFVMNGSPGRADGFLVRPFTNRVLLQKTGALLRVARLYS